MPLTKSVLDFVDSIPPEAIEANSVGIPQDTLAGARNILERKKIRERYLRDKYVWGLVAPLSGTRLGYARDAMREISSPEERAWLVEEVARAAKMKEWAERKAYAKSGFLGRFSKQAQKVGGAFAEAGTGMVEAAKSLATGMGAFKDPDDLRFLNALESAKQSKNPYIPRDARLSLKAAAGASGMTPDMSAGLLANAAGGPAAMFGYWTARTSPERVASLRAMGIPPAASAAGGVATGAVESAIELMNVDPTGVATPAAAAGKGFLRRQIGRVASPLVGRVAATGIGALRRTGVETLEEGLQAGVREVAMQLGAKSVGAKRGKGFKGIPGQMLSEMKEAAPGIAILGAAGGGAQVATDVKRFMRFSEGTRSARQNKRILKMARDGKAPSRKAWRELGLPPELGRSQEERREAVRDLASDIQTTEQVRAVLSGVVPTAEQWRMWGFPEELAKDETRKQEYLVQQLDEARAEEADENLKESEGKVAPEDADATARSQRNSLVDVIVPSEDAAQKERVNARGRDKPTAPTKVQQILRDALSLASPAHINNETRKAAHILRESMASSAQQTRAARVAIDHVTGEFFRMSNEDRRDFIMRMEEGKRQKTKRLDVAAKTLRRELDRARIRVQGIGKLEQFIENYFPHLWKQTSGRDTILGKLIHRPFRPSGFLKRRSIPTIREGLAQGLELVSDNPVELTLIRIQQMNEYVAKTQAFNALKASGLARFVPASFEKDYRPAGYRFVDDPTFVVQATADVTIQEAYDDLLRSQLLSVAGALGITHKREAKLPGGALGVASLYDAVIKTRVGAPLSVLAHEIGHKIGDLYGLHDWMLEQAPQTKEEMTALAQLRFEGHVPTAEFRQYVEQAPEKEAVMLEAWLSAPAKMEAVAPTVTKYWRKFLAANDHVAPLLMLDRSLVLGQEPVTIEQPGIRVLGRWALPDGVARMIENHLSPGLRRSQIRSVKQGYDLARYIGNAMNQASLSLSLFHGLNVMTDAIASQYALGMQQIARGAYAKGAANLALGLTQIGPGARALRRGSVLLEAMNQDLDIIENPQLRAEIETIIAAGGRAYMDERYHNFAMKHLRETFRRIRYEGALDKVAAFARMPVDMIFAGLEATSWPVMYYMVPRLKLGVFSQMAQDIYDRADREGLDDFQIREQLTQAWDSVDNRMGQLAYDNLFWNQYVKDASMLAVRSVGWNLGSIREYGGAILDTTQLKTRMARGDQLLSRKMAYFVGAVATYAPIGAALTYLLTGAPPDDLKDYFFPRTGKKNPDGSDERISLPTYAKDWVAWPTDPKRTALHKMHPMWGTMGSMLRNEDYYGTEIRNGDDDFVKQLADSVAFVSKSFVPFSIHNYVRMKQAGDVDRLAVPLAILGISSAPGYITRTRAQKLALKTLIIENNLEGRRSTKEEAVARRKRKNLLTKGRSGEKISPEDVAFMSDRQKKIFARDLSMTPYQSMFFRLSLNGMLKVYPISNEKERSQTIGILVSKFRRAESPTDDQIEVFKSIVEEFEISDLTPE